MNESLAIGLLDIAAWLSSPLWGGTAAIITGLSLLWAVYSTYRLCKTNEANENTNYLYSHLDIYFDYETKKEKISNEFKGFAKALNSGGNNDDLSWKIYAYTNKINGLYELMLAQDEKKLIDVLISLESWHNTEATKLCEVLMKLSSKIIRNRRSVDLIGKK